MKSSLQDELTDAVFKTALEPNAWGEVMRLMKERFPSSAQTFYFLHLQPRRVRPISLVGIEPRWLDSFDSFYFATDNPWIRLTQRLHRPGIVRTNERLERLLRDPGALYRSSYYNDWMRPQGFKYSIGNTLLADDGVVANVTLLRSPELATFDNEEVKAFAALSRNLTRALAISVRLERAEGGLASGRAFDALPHAIAFVDAQARLVYANRGMESLLHAKRGLSLQQGVLHAGQPEAQERLVACISNALAARAADTPPLAPLNLRYDDAACLVVRAMPMPAATRSYLPSRPTVLLVIEDTQVSHCPSCDELRSLYGFTRSEARLAQQLILGNALGPAAKAIGVTYGTARAYLKVMFEKAGVHSQAQLVAGALRDAAAQHA